MLLFKEAHKVLILDGRKTQTRRMWKRRRTLPGSLHYAQTRMLDSSSRFAVLRIGRGCQERLWDISAADADAEGYPTQTAYLEAFARINKCKFADTLRLTVWAVEFKVEVIT